MATDKGYSVQSLRDWLAEQKIEAVIPHKESEPARQDPAVWFDRCAYRERCVAEQTIQTSMVESARLGFSESELDDLRVVVRLTVEFEDHLQHGNPGLRDIVEKRQDYVGGNIPIRMHELELRYVNASTLSGIEFFCRVNDAYKILAGSMKSKIACDVASVQSLEELFVTAYREFTTEGDFLKKCRLLLDLFKIQIVFAGVSYD